MEELNEAVAKLEALHKLSCRVDRLPECKLKETVKKRIVDALSGNKVDTPLGVGSSLFIRRSRSSSFSNVYLIKFNELEFAARVVGTSLQVAVMDYTVDSSEQLAWKSVSPSLVDA